MDITKYYAIDGEKPLDVIKPDGGLTGIFRTIACIGDSLSSGEFESLNEAGEKGYHDMFEYSWGQFMARAAGCKVYNFSRGGMTAKEYCQSYANIKGFWDPDKKCQAYIMALGVNDLYNRKQEIGTVDDIDLENSANNKDTFAGWYGKIIQNYRWNEPKARFFLMTMPRSEYDSAETTAKGDAHAALLYDMAKFFPFTYVLDFRQYAPVYDAKFRENFYLGGHLNPAGYLLTAQMTMSYIDYIIRNNPEDFTQVGFIGKGGIHNVNAKW